jgi:hypothetical protein
MTIPFFNLATRVARFLLVQNTKNGEKYTKLPQNIPNGHKIFPMAVNRPNGHKIYQDFP